MQLGQCWLDIYLVSVYPSHDMLNPKVHLQKIDKLSDCKEALGHVPTRRSRRIDRGRHGRCGVSLYTYRTIGEKDITGLLRFFTRWGEQTTPGDGA